MHTQDSKEPSINTQRRLLFLCLHLVITKYIGGAYATIAAIARDSIAERTAAEVSTDEIAPLVEEELEFDDDVDSAVATFVGVLFSPSFGAAEKVYVFLNAFDFLPLHTGCVDEHANVSTAVGRQGQKKHL